MLQTAGYMESLIIVAATVTGFTPLAIITAPAMVVMEVLVFAPLKIKGLWMTGEGFGWWEDEEDG